MDHARGSSRSLSAGWLRRREGRSSVPRAQRRSDRSGLRGPGSHWPRHRRRAVTPCAARATSRAAACDVSLVRRCAALLRTPRLQGSRAHQRQPQRGASARHSVRLGTAPSDSCETRSRASARPRRRPAPSPGRRAHRPPRRPDSKVRAGVRIPGSLTAPPKLRVEPFRVPEEQHTTMSSPLDSRRRRCGRARRRRFGFRGHRDPSPGVRAEHDYAATKQRSERPPFASWPALASAARTLAVLCPVSRPTSDRQAPPGRPSSAAPRALPASPVPMVPTALPVRPATGEPGPTGVTGLPGGFVAHMEGRLSRGAG